MTVAAEPQVVVDNSSGNHASEGTVLQADPTAAKVAVKNLHSFWTNTNLQPAGPAKLTAANPLNALKDRDDIGGLYAMLGAIGPDDRAVWNGTFDTTKSSSVLVQTSPSGADHPAGVLNLLTIFASMFTTVPKVSTVEAVFNAAQTVQKAPDFMGAVHDFQSPAPFTLASHIYKLLSDPQQRIVLQQALAYIGVPVTANALEQLLVWQKIYKLSTMVRDMGTSIILQNSAGQILFYPKGSGTSPAEAQATCLNLQFTYDSSLAKSVSAKTLPQGTLGLPTSAYPQHNRCGLEGYPVIQPNGFESAVRAYSVSDFEAVNPTSAESIKSLGSLLAQRIDLSAAYPPHQPPDRLLPFLPLENAGAAFYLKPHYLDFQNGSGISYLTLLTQGKLAFDGKTLADGGLFYTFQGLTKDGKQYISATFPVAVTIPLDPAPANWNEDNQALAAYNQSVLNKLQQADSSKYRPNLDQLDALVRSLNVAPQPSAPSAVPASDFSPFAQRWVRRDFYIAIDTNGHGTGHWRVYKWCNDDPTPPCDTNDLSTRGGYGEVVFSRVEGSTAYGEVTASNDPGSGPLPDHYRLVPGPILLILKSYDMALLEQGSTSITFCGPDYRNEAPQSVIDSLPCGGGA
jgi:hypothetical protein